MTTLLNARTIGEDILREAAEQAAVFDPHLAATLNDLAADYAGPYTEETE
jgi:hypothetical protein